MRELHEQKKPQKGDPRREVVHDRLKISLLESPISDKDAFDISRLLRRTTEQYKDTKGGHVPAHLVDDIIHPIYTSEYSIKNTFDKYGYRFITRDVDTDELLGTILIARDPNLVFIVNGQTFNQPLDQYPNMQPANYHGAINFATNIDMRRKGIAWQMLDAIVSKFRNKFSGEGICLRADPPSHDAFLKLGFFHETSWDEFLPPDVEMPMGFNSVEDFNHKYVCSCPRSESQKALLNDRRYKYGVFTKKFDSPNTPDTPSQES